MTADSLNPTPPAPIRCETVHAQIAAYRAGTLDADAAWQVEWHAAHCEPCDALLDAPLDLEPQAWLRAENIPSRAERDAMRGAILGSRGATQAAVTVRSRARWAWAVGIAAAAAVVVMVIGDARPPAPVQAVSVDRATPRPSSTGVDIASASMVRARELAAIGAAEQFAALDAAARELDAVRARRADDAELRAFRGTLEAQRRELARLVASVAE
jgi:hypothetical protein